MISRGAYKIARILFWFSLTGLTCFGFRIIPQEKYWEISGASATASKLFLDFTSLSHTLKNNLPASDPLGGAGATIAIGLAMNSIMDDYNNIQSAYVTLVDTSDGDYAANSTNRVITIEEAPPSGLSSGEAKLVVENGQVVGCKIALASKTFDDAKFFIRTMTHEIGHCLGLAHPQETVNAVMSYFSDGDSVVRLQIDDKMGIVHLYPVNPEDGQEFATYGLSCSKK